MTRTVPVRGWGSALEATLLMQIRAAVWASTGDDDEDDDFVPD